MKATGEKGKVFAADRTGAVRLMRETWMPTLTAILGVAVAPGTIG